MKIGPIDILKAYLGALELTSSNAFIGSIPIIDNPTPIEYAGLKMTSTGNSTVALAQQGTAPTVDLKYSFDGVNWTQWDYSAISLRNGQTVCFKGQNTTFATNISNYNYFVMTGSISASGDIMSIIDDGACNTTTIPATNCFAYLFNLCTALKSAPDLSATVLTDQCYIGMFRGCTSLVEPPVFLANTLAYNCCANMFRECASLIRAPYLGATNLATYCYSNMFVDCTSLVEVQQTLPTTQLSNYCYRFMFSGCTALTTAPELPATVLTESCYYGMFRNCTNLNYIKCLATNISATDCTTGWVKGVAATGTFIKDPSMTGWSTGENGIPTGWTAMDAYKGLKMTSTGNSTVALAQNGSAPTVDLKYSLDEGETWTQWNKSAISLSDGDSVCFKGQNTQFATTTNDYNKFVMTGSIAASGNIMSIIDNGACNTTTIPNNYCFCALFRDGCISDITNLSLPATTLTEGCYQGMFYNNSLLTSVPENLFNAATIMQTNCYKGMFERTSITSIPDNLLPATTLATQCYQAMFGNCKSLTTVPTNLLPATTLATGCYYNMFKGCTSLKNVTYLPATTLAQNCYYSMFEGCTSIEDVPLNLLPATTMQQQCYRYMFRGCTSLKNVTYLPATTLAQACYANIFENCPAITAVPYDLLPATALQNYCYEGIFKNCTSLQNAPQLPATKMKTGCYASLFEGCTSLVVAPELHATSLVQTCYQQLFDGCTNLRYINCWVNNNSSGAYTKNWVRGVSNLSTCLFQTSGLSNWSTGDSGIPTGWIPATSGYNYDCMKFTAKGEMSLAITNYGTNARSIRYEYHTNTTDTLTGTISTDPDNPTMFPDGATVFLYSTTVVNSGSRSYPRWSSSTSNYTAFSKMTGEIYAHGSVFSLTFGIKGYPSYNVSYDSSSQWLFGKLFMGRGGLKTPPKLDCGSHASTTAISCMYSNMFENCTGLIVAPVLKETTLANGCYQYLIKNCSNVVVAPKLNALTISQDAYKHLFRGCSRLGQVMCKATNISASGCITDWLTYVRSNGTLYVDSTMTSASWGVPSDWTVKAA